MTSKEEYKRNYQRSFFSSVIVRKIEELTAELPGTADEINAILELWNNPELTHDKELTPLRMACEIRLPKAVSILLDSGADYENSGETVHKILRAMLQTKEMVCSPEIMEKLNLLLKP